MKQWQPAFHALPPDGCARGFISRVARRRSERGQVLLAKPRQHIIVKQDFADRCKGDAFRIPCRPLRFGVEGAEGFQCVAEKVETIRFRRGRRENIDDPAPNRELPMLAHGA